jgi:hypothetical protein
VNEGEGELLHHKDRQTQTAKHTQTQRKGEEGEEE